MIKKTVSVILLFLVCFILSASACSNEKSQNAEDNIQKEEISSLGAPEEVLSGPTSGLLEYFLKSDFMAEELEEEETISWHTGRLIKNDYCSHKAFSELVSRGDLAAVLEDYAGKILRGEYVVEYSSDGKRTSFDKVLMQQSVIKRLPVLERYPNLKKTYEVIDAVGTEYLDADYLYLYEADTQRYEKEHSAPEEVLSGPTSGLLEYFLKSDVMKYELIKEGYMSSAFVKPREIDYTDYEAFAEFISRDDFAEVLEDYAGKIFRGEYGVEYTMSGDDTSFDKILRQPSVKNLLADLTEYPALEKRYNRINEADLREEWMFGAPDEVLNSPTSELLEFFLNSNFMHMQLYVYSHPEYGEQPPEINYEYHEAFYEFTMRYDFKEVLEDYAGKILRGEYSPEYTLDKKESSFDKVLRQHSVKVKLYDLTDCPNLKKMYDSLGIDI